MLLGNLLKSEASKHKKIPVEGISYDSRNVKKGYIFFAIAGASNSGIKFVNEALSNGASVIVSQKKIKLKNTKTPFLLVRDVRKSLSKACSNFYKKNQKT